MSGCSMMGGPFGGVLIAGMVITGLAYSCGPNVVVGAAATVIYGGMSCRDKIRKIVLERELANSTSNQMEAQAYLRWKLKCTQQELDYDLDRTGAWAISIFPLFGPLVGYCVHNQRLSKDHNDEESKYWQRFEAESHGRMQVLNAT